MVWAEGVEPSPSRLISRQHWLGITRQLKEVSPTLSSSASSPVFQASTQVFFKSAASAIPPRPRGCLNHSVGWIRQSNAGFCNQTETVCLRIMCRMSFFASQGGNLYGSQSWPDRRTRRAQMAHQGFIWAAITKLTDANITIEQSTVRYGKSRHT